MNEFLPRCQIQVDCKPNGPPALSSLWTVDGNEMGQLSWSGRGGEEKNSEPSGLGQLTAYKKFSPFNF
jgi:hypothetical protein